MENFQSRIRDSAQLYVLTTYSFQESVLQNPVKPERFNVFNTFCNVLNKYNSTWFCECYDEGLTKRHAVLKFHTYGVPNNHISVQLFRNTDRRRLVSTSWQLGHILVFALCFYCTTLHCPWSFEVFVCLLSIFRLLHTLVYLT